MEEEAGAIAGITGDQAPGPGEGGLPVGAVGVEGADQPGVEEPAEGRDGVEAAAPAVLEAVQPPVDGGDHRLRVRRLDHLGQGHRRPVGGPAGVQGVAGQVEDRGPGPRAIGEDQGGRGEAEGPGEVGVGAADQAPHPAVAQPGAEVAVEAFEGGAGLGREAGDVALRGRPSPLALDVAQGLCGQRQGHVALVQGALEEGEEAAAAPGVGVGEEGREEVRVRGSPGARSFARATRVISSLPVRSRSTQA